MTIFVKSGLFNKNNKKNLCREVFFQETDTVYLSYDV